MVQELHAGRDPVRAWIDDLVMGVNADTIPVIARLSETMAVQWDQACRRLGDTIAPDSDPWLADLRETLRLRDDLASVSRVLRRLDAGGALDVILAQADAEAASWIRALPFRPPLEDEHLAEVARLEDPFWARRAWLHESD